MNKFIISLLIFRILFIRDVGRLLLMASGGLMKMARQLSDVNNSLFNDLAEKVGYEKRMPI